MVVVEEEEEEEEEEEDHVAPNLCAFQLAPSIPWARPYAASSVPFKDSTRNGGWCCCWCINWCCWSMSLGRAETAKSRVERRRRLEEEAGKRRVGGMPPSLPPPPAPPLPSPKISARTASFRFPSLVALWALVSMASHHCPFPGEGLLEGEGRGGKVEASPPPPSSPICASATWFMAEMEMRVRGEAAASAAEGGSRAEVEGGLRVVVVVEVVPLPLVTLSPKKGWIAMPNSCSGVNPRVFLYQGGACRW